MKHLFFKKGLASLALLAALSAHATNGDNLIGYGPISQAMGGSGVAMGMGPESILKNPALIQTPNQFEFLFSGTYFSPTVTSGFQGGSQQTSKANTFLIPSVAFINKINDQYSFGLGAYGVSGLGVDYRGADANSGLSKMSTSLSLMKFAPSLAYSNENLKVGASLAIMYGTLAISYDRAPNTSVGSESPGKSETLGYGVDLGVAYQLNDYLIGLNYQSAISMTYDYQLKDAASDFQITSEINSDTLTQPDELALGVSRQWDSWGMSLDYRMINWANATGYKEFGWDNQTVYALGGSYKFNDVHTLRFGYNFSPNSPLGQKAIENSTSSARGPINYFNLVGFPATSKSHISVGVTHQFSKGFSLDSALVVSPEESTTALFDADGPGSTSAMTYKTTHAETNLTVAGRWTF